MFIAPKTLYCWRVSIRGFCVSRRNITQLPHKHAMRELFFLEALMDRYDDYWKSFYVKQYEWWKEVFVKTKNPEAAKRANEFKDLLYKKFLMILETVTAAIPASDNGQYLLF